MKVKYKDRTGRPSKVAAALKNSISNYANHARAFRIGITNWPEQRASAYRSEGWKFDKMIVLYSTQSRKNAVKLEKELIEHNWEWDKLENYRGGGGGTHGEGWYYLYIVLRR